MHEIITRMESVETNANDIGLTPSSIGFLNWKQCGEARFNQKISRMECSDQFKRIDLICLPPSSPYPFSLSWSCISIWSFLFELFKLSHSLINTIIFTIILQFVFSMLSTLSDTPDKWEDNGIFWINFLWTCLTRLGSTFL